MKQREEESARVAAEQIGQLIISSERITVFFFFVSQINFFAEYLQFVTEQIGCKFNLKRIFFLAAFTEATELKKHSKIQGEKINFKPCYSAAFPYFHKIFVEYFSPDVFKNILN